MSIEIFGFDRWTLIGPDIENMIQPRRPYVKVLLGELREDRNVKNITVTMYKDVFDGLRNGVYTAALTITSDHRRVFKVYWNGSEIAFQANPEEAEQQSEETGTENPAAYNKPPDTKQPKKNRLGNF